MLCTKNAERIASCGEPVILLLSGGMDSLTAFYSFYDAGVDFQCVHFNFQGKESRDTPCAQHVCERLGVQIELITIPEPTWDDVKLSAKECVRYFGRVRKVKTETYYAARYVSELMPDSCVIVSAKGGDTLFGYHTSQAIEAAKLGDSHPVVIKKRYGDKVKDEFRIFGEFGRNRVYEDFFYDTDICDFCTQFPSNALNRRFPKSMMYYAFEDYHKANSTYRRPQSFVKASGEDSMFEKMAKQMGFKDELSMFKEAAKK